MKKVLCCFMLFFVTLCVFPNEDTLRNELREKVLCKSIFDYFAQTGYQNQYKFIYEIYGATDDVFKLLSQPREKMVYMKIKIIEEYTYYGIHITIHQMPNGTSGYYYLAAADITGTGLGFELLLFDRQGVFLDKYSFLSKYKNDKKLYEFKELFEDTYGIISLINTSSSGSYSEYLRFLIIESDRFKEVFVYRFSVTPGEDR